MNAVGSPLQMSITRLTNMGGRGGTQQQQQLCEYVGKHRKRHTHMDSQTGGLAYSQRGNRQLKLVAMQVIHSISN
jgi:hypothetical protein